ncbi:MAG: L-aspartate oxidase [Gammaproteobacteria bacterium]|nr:L-aspartate oxidase [Gammaproteobacteria bacterium]
MKAMHSYDVVIIGSGAAGLGLALSLPKQVKIAIISKANLLAGSSMYAQGGIAAVMDKTDSFESHINDTIKTGAGLCNPQAVRCTVENGRHAIEWLIAQGVEFTRGQNNAFHLNQEGGHSHRRLLHAADHTGKVVVNSLLQQVQRCKNIDCFSQCTAVDLLTKNNTCYGIKVLTNSNHHYDYFSAKTTVLACGGANSIYLNTTNYDCTSGDGIAMAYRVGCEITNLEFIQFHPTCLYNPNGETILISEALRGEGAHLILQDGKRFMFDYDKRGELAPRDIVARAITDIMQQKHLQHVYLDISHKPADFIQTHFPTIYQKCLRNGIDITHQPIPVAPAAHYTCGGVATNLQGGTELKNLYAIGEVAHTGLHGANRIGSNSLLECIVFAANCSQAIQKALQHNSFDKISITIEKISNRPPAKLDTAKLMQQLRQLMSAKVGVMRSNQSLRTALQAIEHLQSISQQALKTYQPNKALIELNNAIQVAMLIVQSALARHESRGAHFNIDYPDQLDKPSNTALKRQNSSALIESGQIQS